MDNKSSVDPRRRAEEAAAKVLALVRPPSTQDKEEVMHGQPHKKHSTACSRNENSTLVQELSGSQQEEQQEQPVVQQEQRQQQTDLKEPTDNFANELKNPARYAKLEACVKLLSAWANDADQRGGHDSFVIQ